MVPYVSKDIQQVWDNWHNGKAGTDILQNTFK